MIMGTEYPTSQKHLRSADIWEVGYQWAEREMHTKIKIAVAKEVFNK